MKLTKSKIEEMANEIIKFLKKHDLEEGVCIYFNNKRIRFGSEWDRENKTFIPFEKVEEDMNPLDYFEYANPKHILSMSFEGAFYEVMNGYNDYQFKLQDKFNAILDKYHLYAEQGHAWNLTCYPDTIDYDEIEYTDYEDSVEPEPITISSLGLNENVPTELIIIKHMWDKLSETTAHLGGSITSGDGFKFKYNGDIFFMNPPLYQGSMIYEHWIKTIKTELTLVGATDIYYEYGNMN